MFYLFLNYYFSLPLTLSTLKYPEWYSPSLDLEHTIQVCRGDRVKYYFTEITNK